MEPVPASGPAPFETAHRPAHEGGRSRVIGLLVAIAGSALILLLPEPAGLRPEGQRMAAIFFLALVVWATESLPIAISALAVVILQPVLGVTEIKAAFTSFASPVFFFVFAMFCIAQAFASSGVDRRFALWLLSRAGTDSRRVVLAFMIGTAALSTIMSDVPVTAIFMSLGLSLIERLKLQRRQSNLARALMVGIPIAALIGGVGTPAGSSVNVLGIYFIEKYGHVRVSFLQWTAIGIPMVVALVPIAWFVLIRFLPPEVSHLPDLAKLKEEGARGGPLRRSEWKVLGLMSAMISLWILGTWYEQLDVVLIGAGGALAVFLPGMNLVTWKQVERGTGWDSLMMIGGVTSIGAGAVDTGLAKWLVDSTLSGLQGWPAGWIVAAVSAFTVLIHFVVPIGPVVNAVMIPPITLLAVSMGMNPVLFALPVAFTASCAFLLPLDAVSLITYSKGYYSMTDMLKPGSVISLFWVVWMTVLMIVLGPLLGFF